MAASETQIANIALAYISRERIESLTEIREEARWANELYPFARDSVTEQPGIIWRHAKRTLTLAETDNDRDSDYAYAYERPSDCLSFRYILPLYGAFDPTDPIRFECEGDVIYTDEYQARGVYVRQITDVTKFVPSFTDAVAWRLANLLVSPLRLENKLLETTAWGYSTALRVAIANGSAEQVWIKTAEEAMPDWQRARG